MVTPMKRAFFLVTAAALLSAPAPARAPQFETAARTAFLIDLSSGAVLYEKNADQRMPPASMAKMMTTEVATIAASLLQLMPVLCSLCSMPAPYT